jgi:hypothetical protein
MDCYNRLNILQYPLLDTLGRKEIVINLAIGL